MKISLTLARVSIKIHVRTLANERHDLMKVAAVVARVDVAAESRFIYYYSA